MTLSPSAVNFAGQQSYALQDDQVYLHAELAVQGPLPSFPLALQLRATREDAPSVTIKLAELAISAHEGDGYGLIPVQGTVPVALPAGHSSYALSLVVVETGDTGVTEHDCILFPNPTVFDLPQLSGAASVSLQADNIQLTVPGLFNPRPSGSLSGSLTLALWALPQPYQGGAFTGVLIGQQDLGQLAGQDTLGEQDFTLPLPQALAGDWVLTLMLREWTASGYLTRDYQTLPGVLPVAAAAIAETALPVKADVPPVNVSATATEKPQVVTAPADAGVSINTASVETLTAVKGVSAKLAAAIVAGRPYAALIDLLAVKGMGEKLLAKIGGGLGL